MLDSWFEMSQMSCTIVKRYYLIRIETWRGWHAIRNDVSPFAILKTAVGIYNPGARRAFLSCATATRWGNKSLGNPKRTLRDEDVEQEWMAIARTHSTWVWCLPIYQALVVITTFLSERSRSSHPSINGEDEEDEFQTQEFPFPSRNI